MPDVIRHVAVDCCSLSDDDWQQIRTGAEFAPLRAEIEDSFIRTQAANKALQSLAKSALNRDFRTPKEKLDGWKKHVDAGCEASNQRHRPTADDLVTRHTVRDYNPFDPAGLKR